MRLYVDLDLRQVVTGLGVKQPVSTIYLTRGDALDLEIQFTQAGAVVDPTPDSVFFCIKSQGDHDGDPLVLLTAFAKTGSGNSAIWTGQPNLNTADLNTALGIGAGADVASLIASAEFCFIKSGRQTTTRVVRCTIENDLYRVDEEAPVDATAEKEGTVALTSGVQSGTVTFVPAFGTPPTKIQLTVKMPDGAGAVLFASYHSDSVSGFSYVLSAEPPGAGYTLNWRATV